MRLMVDELKNWDSCAESDDIAERLVLPPVNVNQRDRREKKRGARIGSRHQLYNLDVIKADIKWVKEVD
jgi:hypothetical protein